MHPKRIPPGPNQQSVWDYPRPPALEPVSRRGRVMLNGEVVAETECGVRTLETSHPPVYYVPPDCVLDGLLVPSRRMRDTLCEFKGVATYFALDHKGMRADPAAWSYPQTVPAFDAMRDYIGFYAKVFDCYLDDEKVAPQEGDFYGGWITAELVGPFKGGPGTWGW